MVRNSLLKQLVFVLGVFLWGQGLMAQRLPAPEVLTVEDGLSFRHVDAIVQDADGLMWFGTSNGLCRYDGYRFLNFGKSPLLDHPFPASEFKTNSLVFLNDSLLWAVADYQLFSMNIHTFETKKIEGIPGQVKNILKGKQGAIWLTSDDEQWMFLWQYDPALQFRKIAQVPRHQYKFSDLGVDTSGNIWWCTSSEGLKAFTPKGTLKEELKLDSFMWYGRQMYNTDFFIDHQNRFFFLVRNKGNTDEIWQYFQDNGQKKRILTDIKLLSFEAMDDSQGNIWFVRNSGAFRFEPDGQMTDYTQVLQKSLDFSQVNVLFEDANNVLWIGTDGGLLKIPVHQQRFDNHFYKKGQGWGNAMRGITEDLSGNLYFICENGDKGFYRMQKESGQMEKLPFGMSEPAFYDLLGQANFILFDKRRNCLWTMDRTLTRSHLAPLELEHQNTLSFGREVSNKNPIAFFPDGKILFGNTLDKMAIYNPETGRQELLTKNGLKEFENVLTQILLPLSKDSIWVGTEEHGLFLLNGSGEILQHYHTTSQPAINSNRVPCLYFDGVRDLLWAGTFSGGLYSIHTKTGVIRHFTQLDGLPDNNIASILGEGQYLWIGTYNGLSCFNLEGETFRNFFQEDGLTHNEFNYTSAFKASDGKMYFGGMNGINSFYPQDLLREQGAPPLKLTRFLKHDQQLDSLFTYQTRAELTGPFEISPDISYFQFEWTLPNYLNSRKTQYFTWLEGLEDDWTSLGSTPSIRFNKLPQGTYTLHLKGKDHKGNWTTMPLSIPIRVVPPWWNTWWAYAVFFLLLAGTGTFFWKRETRRLLLQSELDKEHLEAERLRELDQVKTRFFANISHEFRTPLTIISGMTDQMEEAPQQWFEEGLQMIRRNSNRLLSLVNQLLDLSKLESGKITLDLQQSDIIGFLRYLVKSVQSYAETKHIGVHFYAEEESLIMDFDGEKIQHVFSNLLSNALKFTPKNGNVYISVEGIQASPGQQDTSPEAFLEVKVRNTGPGIPVDQLPYVFDRFYQVDDSSTRRGEGSGIGLALVKELIHLMKGEIWVKSKPGIETTFTFHLPITNQAPKDGPVNRRVAPKLQLGLAVGDQHPVEPTVEQPAAQTKPRILIVEDNADVVAYIASCLQETYHIQVGQDGQEGIEIALADIPDLIITDVMMPRKDGFEVCSTLKTDERTSHIPIIMLTAKADMDSKLEGLEMGADAYLAKPFHKKELLVRIKKLLELRKKLQQHFRAVAGIAWEVDPSSQQEAVSREDQFLKKLRLVVEAHLDDQDFSVQSFCREVAMSRSQLHRKLIALVDCSPNKFIRQIRLNQAKLLLRNQEHSIATVAYETGFSDQGYFGRLFKKEFGVTPQEWREREGVQ